MTLRFEALIWSQPRVIVEGELRPATTEQDVRTQLSLAERKGIDAVKARYMVFDSRTKKPPRYFFAKLAQLGQSGVLSEDEFLILKAPATQDHPRGDELRVHIVDQPCTRGPAFGWTPWASPANRGEGS